MAGDPEALSELPRLEPGIVFDDLGEPRILVPEEIGYASRFFVEGSGPADSAKTTRSGDRRFAVLATRNEAGIADEADR